MKIWDFVTSYRRYFKVRAVSPICICNALVDDGPCTNAVLAYYMGHMLHKYLSTLASSDLHVVIMKKVSSLANS